MRVLAATRPGRRATRLAKTTAPRATAAIERVGTVGCGTAEIPSANNVHSQRPRAIPIGIPSTTPMTAATDDVASDLRTLLGERWDDELEPFRHAGEGTPVRWLHQVV